jgi:hypothetical protein
MRARGAPQAGRTLEWGGFGARIINLLTQEGSFEHGAHPGRAAPAHVNHCLKRLRHAIEKHGLTSIALPRLATGVGGLDWKDVQPLVVQHRGDSGDSGDRGTRNITQAWRRTSRSGSFPARSPRRHAPPRGRGVSVSCCGAGGVQRQNFRMV